PAGRCSRGTVSGRDRRLRARLPTSPCDAARSTPAFSRAAVERPTSLRSAEDAAPTATHSRRCHPSRKARRAEDQVWARGATSPAPSPQRGGAEDRVRARRATAPPPSPSPGPPCPPPGPPPPTRRRTSADRSPRRAAALYLKRRSTLAAVYLGSRRVRRPGGR